MISKINKNLTYNRFQMFPISQWSINPVITANADFSENCTKLGTVADNRKLVFLMLDNVKYILAKFHINRNTYKNLMRKILTKNH